MPSNNRTHSRWIILVLLIPALLGVCFVVLSTRWGAGTSPDSAGYIFIARSLASGDGYRGLYGGPAPIWPPMYPFILAASGVLGADPLAAARWINVALFGATILVMGLMLRICTRSIWLAALGVLLVATSVDLIEIHAMAWTEPLFMLFSLIGLWCLAAYAERPRAGMLLVAALAAAVATLTRYIGLSLIATGVLVVLLRGGRSRLRRFAEAGIFAVVAGLPTALWAVRNLLLTGTATARTPGFHLVTLKHLRNAVQTAALWILPPSVPAVLRTIALIITLAAGVAAIVVIARRGRPRPDTVPSTPASDHLRRVTAVFAGLYVLQLLVSISFFDRQTPLDARILAPLHVVLVLVGLCLVGELLDRRMLPRPLRIVVVVLLALLVLGSVNRTVWRVNWISQEGLGYTTSRWRDSDTIRHIRDVEPGTPINTNAPAAVYLLTHRPVSLLPTRISYWTGKPNPDLAAELAALRDRLEKPGAVIAYFDSVPGHAYIASRKDLTAAIPLRVCAQTADGTIYELDQSTPAIAPR